MKNLKSLDLFVFAIVVVCCSYICVPGQSLEERNKLASISATGAGVRWDASVPNAGLSVTVSAPDGRLFRREYKAGSSAEFALSDKDGSRLPDGQYTYELRLNPVLQAGIKEEVAASRGRDDEPEAVRSARRRVVLPSLVQSGSFLILNGAVIVAGAEEAGRPQSNKISESPRLPAVTSASVSSKSRLHHAPLFFRPDDVIADDLIVQGSACVGLDCVNGEVFGFDTIRTKENNDRIQFDDTSTGVGFPTNNWQIRANSSASGGASFLAFVDQGATGNS